MKNLLKNLVAIVFGLVLLEAFSFVALLAVYRDDPASRYLLSHFPANLRLKKHLLMNVVYSGKAFTGDKNTDQMVSAYYFDALLGFTDERWAPDKAGGGKNGFNVCCLGGSTTYDRNWPIYLNEQAEKRGVAEKLHAINAGVPGYFSTNQHLYLTRWIMGRYGIRCDAVLSMDGVNDIHFRIAAYTRALASGTEWNPSYHGYQQSISDEIGSMSKPSGAMMHFVRTLFGKRASHWVVAARLFPYTTRFVYALCGAGENPKAELEKAVRRNLKMNSRGEFILPKSVEARIMNDYRQSLLDLAGACRERGIPFTDFLQPVYLDRYYNSPSNRGLHDYANKVPMFIGHNLGGDYSIDTNRLYLETEKMYAELAAGHGEDFTSLIHLFDGHRDKEMYVDTVHYTREGSELIAGAVIDDLLKKGVLHRKP